MVKAREIAFAALERTEETDQEWYIRISYIIGSLKKEIKRY